MLCQELGKCRDLSYCAEMSALLHVGEAVDGLQALDAVWVVFTDIATGRKTSLEADLAGGIVDVSMVDFQPIPDHVYRVELAISKYGGGIHAVALKPYEHTPAGGFAVSTQEFDALLVRFVKNHDLTGITGYSEQWMSL